jgi:hypothetical protein
MRKLELKIEDLSVESFNTAGSEDERGTVHAHASDGPASGCMYCEPTYQVGAYECYSYAVECPASQVPTNCTDSEPTNYWCDSCRDSVTACG